MASETPGTPEAYTERSPSHSDAVMKAYGTYMSPEQGDFDESLGLPRGFLGHIAQEDDWSFFIKLSALIEAALTHALVTHFNADPPLQEHLRRLNVRGKTGKVTLANNAGLISNRMANFIEKVTALRNDNAHDIRNVYFDLRDHLAKLDQGKHESLVSAVLVPEDVGDRKQLLAEKPKQAFIWSANAVLEKLVRTQG